MHWSGRAAPCFQRLRPAKAAAPGVEQNWEGGMKKMAVCTGRAFYLTPPPPRSAVQPCIAARVSWPLCQRLLRLLPPAPGDLLGKAGGLAFSQGPPQEAGGGVKGTEGLCSESAWGAQAVPGGPWGGVAAQCHPAGGGGRRVILGSLGCVTGGGGGADESYRWQVMARETSEQHWRQLGSTGGGS